MKRCEVDDPSGQGRRVEWKSDVDLASESLCYRAEFGMTKVRNIVARAGWKAGKSRPSQMAKANLEGL